MIAYVLHYWLRRIARGVIGLGGMVEATLRRIANRTGDKPIPDDIDWASLDRKL